MRRTALRNRMKRVQRLRDRAAERFRAIAGDQNAEKIERLWIELRQASRDIRGLMTGPGWRTPTEELNRRTEILLRNKNLNEFGVDPFGLSPEYVRKVVRAIEFIQRIYFRAEVHDIDNVPAQGRCLLISNHSGQLPLDAVVIGSSLLLDRDPPRMIRSMVEKFATRLPFFGTFCVRCGQVTGLPENCIDLLEREESVLVFPEGAKGISKPFQDRYKMTAFGHGFMRLALATGSPIVPIAVVGAEEQIINLGDIKFLARLLNMPNVPVPPLALILGPMAMWPMPVKYRVYFGEPLYFEGDANDDESVIATKVARVRAAIDEMLQKGLAERKGIFV